MKIIIIGLMLVLLTGCTFNQYQRDVANNRYNEIDAYADPSATYVGEWTAVSNVGVRSIKIRGDGRIKVCLSTSAGVSDGKVFIKDDQPAFMMKTGATAEIVSLDEESMVLYIYGRQEKYYTGLVPKECLSTFNNF